MSQPSWIYIPSQDKNVWWLFFAGLFGAVPAAMLLPAGCFAFVTEQRAHQPPFISLLFLALGSGLALWAFGCWVAAVRRVKRIKHLTQAGVPVRAIVDGIKLQHGRHRRTIVAVVFSLRYELDGRHFETKKRTNMRGIIGPAREFKHIDLAVDPNLPTSFAFVSDGRLG